MAPPPLNPTTRYFAPGKRKCYFLSTTANYLSPTRAEMNAGVDLSAEIESVTGFSLTAAMISVPDMGSRFVQQIPGALESSKNDIAFYQDAHSGDARTLFAIGVTGFILMLWDGDVAGQLMDVFPVQTASVAPDPGITKSASLMVSFAPSAVPAIGVIIPAG